MLVFVSKKSYRIRLKYGNISSCKNVDFYTTTVSMWIFTSRQYPCGFLHHYTDVVMDTIASKITSLMIVYSTVYSYADQRNYQSSTSLAFVRAIHRRPVNSSHKWPVTRKMFPFGDVIMVTTVSMWIFTPRHLRDKLHCNVKYLFQENAFENINEEIYQK